MKLFVLVRKDLRNKSYQAVQAGHAVAEFLLRGPQHSWSNGTLVYLRVTNEDELKQFSNELGEYSSFREIDLDGQMTALATTEVHPRFKDLPLL